MLEMVMYIIMLAETRNFFYCEDFDDVGHDNFCEHGCGDLDGTGFSDEHCRTNLFSDDEGDRDGDEEQRFLRYRPGRSLTLIIFSDGKGWLLVDEARRAVGDELVDFFLATAWRELFGDPSGRGTKNHNEAAQMPSGANGCGQRRECGRRRFCLAESRARHVRFPVQELGRGRCSSSSKWALNRGC